MDLRLADETVLVNNAAATQRKRFLDTTAQDWQAQVDVTVTGMPVRDAVKETRMKDAIGQAVPRTEQLRLITGRGTYVSDLQLPRTKHVTFLRSPHAHARISALDASRARDPAGVRAVFTGQDFGATALRAQSAVGDSLGVAVDLLPITPSDLWQLMQQGRTQ